MRSALVRFTDAGGMDIILPGDILTAITGKPFKFSFSTDDFSDGGEEAGKVFAYRLQQYDKDGNPIWAKTYIPFSAEFFGLRFVIDPDYRMRALGTDASILETEVAVTPFAVLLPDFTTEKFATLDHATAYRHLYRVRCDLSVDTGLPNPKPEPVVKAPVVVEHRRKVKRGRVHG